MTNKIKKIAVFTDVHFGRKNNSEQHNHDCLDFITFFCEQVKQDPEITHIAFLGDLFENRSAVSVFTLHHAHNGLKMIDDLGLPVIHLIGNHDLYHRTTRKIHSAKVFSELKNFQIINEPTVIGDALFAPYLFPDEYPGLMKYQDVPLWFGHFEFRNFIVSGANYKLEHGNDHTAFSKQDFIFSGHFHKRQFDDNIVFIGNAFPMDFGDAGDYQRGMMIYDFSTQQIEFKNWTEMPRYIKIPLSKLANGVDIKPKTRLRCILDIDISYTESQALREDLIQAYKLREFSIEENPIEKKEALNGDLVDLSNIDLSNINELVRNLLKNGIKDIQTISTDKLIQIYEEL